MLLRVGSSNVLNAAISFERYPVSTAGPILTNSGSRFASEKVIVSFCKYLFIMLNIFVLSPFQLVQNAKGSVFAQITKDVCVQTNNTSGATRIDLREQNIGKIQAWFVQLPL